MHWTLLLATLAAAALVPLVAADPHGDCDSDGQRALGIVQITAGTADATFYVDDRNYVFGNGVWGYQESNGIWTPKSPGVYVEGATSSDLQRGGYSCYVPDCLGGHEICSDDSPNGPDWNLF